METGSKHNQVKKIINDYIQVLIEFGKRNAPLAMETLERVVTTDLKIISNGNQIISSSAEFLERWKNIKQKFPVVTISNLSENPVIEENRAAIWYQFERTGPHDQKMQAQIICIITIEKGKIDHVLQVIHEKGSGHIDP
jgi:hypothetical protein